MDIPSGYVLEQPDADAIVRSRAVPEMRDAIANGYPGKTIWFFDRVPNKTRCFEHTVCFRKLNQNLDLFLIYFDNA